VHYLHVLYVGRPWTWMRDWNFVSPSCPFAIRASYALDALLSVKIRPTSRSSIRVHRVTSSTQTQFSTPFAFSATCPVARRHPHLCKLPSFFPISASMTASLPNSSNPLTRLSCFQTRLFDPRPSSSGSWIFSR